VRGSTYKRCQCRDADGRKLKGCRKSHGSWAFRIDAWVDPQTGRRKQLERSGFRTRDKAEAEMTRALAAVNAGAWTDDRAVTVQDWLWQWLAETAERGKSPKTLANYRGHVRDVWVPALGKMRLRDLRRAHVEAVIARLAKPVGGERVPGQQGRRVQRRSAATVDGYRRTLRAALSAAVRRGLIVTNPAQGRLDSLPEREDKELAIWEPEATAAFLNHVSADRLAALYELAAYAGMRRGELCGLRWSDLDAGYVGLTVRQTLVEVSDKNIPEDRRTCSYCGASHTGLMFKGPKSRAGRRWLPLAQPAREALQAHRAVQLEEQAEFGDGYSDHGLVFCSPDGRPLRPGAVTTMFVGHAAKCGLPPIRLHDARHGACSLLIAGGVPIEVVQMILGHSSPTVTRSVYAHMMRQAASDQVEAATQILSQHRRSQSARIEQSLEE